LLLGKPAVTAQIYNYILGKKFVVKKVPSWKNANFEKTGTFIKQNGKILKTANQIEFTFWPF
jgi:hypothetical protein